MALTPEIDNIIVRIADLESLVKALDGVDPIQVTVGKSILVVDPKTMPEAYGRGSDIIRNVSQSAIVDLRNMIATLAIQQSQATSNP